MCSNLPSPNLVANCAIDLVKDGLIIVFENKVTLFALLTAFITGG
jgi:hypothetical protein